MTMSVRTSHSSANFRLISMQTTRKAEIYTSLFRQAAAQGKNKRRKRKATVNEQYQTKLY